MSQNFSSQQFYDSYQNYKCKNLNEKRIKHKDIMQRINALKKVKNFKIARVGKSVEGKDIHLISIGTGKTDVLLWSQMHGDESTATMALFDVFNFLSVSDDFDKFRKKILSKLTLHFIPMLNPDGADKFTRRNSLNIDLNRDALRLQFPESKILKGIRDSLKPKFGFNLHDQNIRYSAGNSYRSATISFLAPAFNYEKDINEVRGNTMKLIVKIYNELSKFIPGHMAKYNDDFEPRAFGDNFIKWGTSSVLIESGGWKNDLEKQFIRKLNYLALLAGFHSIANSTYKSATIKQYNKIPNNDNLLFDVLFRNLTYKSKNKKYKVDLGINRHERITSDFSEDYFESTIDDWGDLSIFYGYDDFDLNGYEVQMSKVFDLKNKELKDIDTDKLLSQGYGFIKFEQDSIKNGFTKLPFNLILNNAKPNLNVEYLNHANFTIWRNKKLMFNVVNGFIYDVNSESYSILNGLIFK
ncbi:MAG: peptidase M14 [Ignavibacteriae bacterium]|nr:peptidase M14 [Ignavibacteriota bacterium]